MECLATWSEGEENEKKPHATHIEWKFMISTHKFFRHAVLHIFCTGLSSICTVWIVKVFHASQFPGTPTREMFSSGNLLFKRRLRWRNLVCGTRAGGKKHLLKDFPFLNALKYPNYLCLTRSTRHQAKKGTHPTHLTKMVHMEVFKIVLKQIHNTRASKCAKCLCVGREKGSNECNINEGSDTTNGLYCSAWL